MQHTAEVGQAKQLKLYNLMAAQQVLLCSFGSVVVFNLAECHQNQAC